jgi:hypothetical protein
VYFPLDGVKRYGFEDELTLIDPSVLEGPDNSGEVAAFLSRVGVKKNDPYSLILHHILPRHAEDKWKESNFTALVGHVAYTKQHLEEYIAGATEGGQSRLAALATLGKTLYLQTKKKEGELTYFARVANVYAGLEYMPSLPLERLLGASADPIRFIANVYLSGEVDERHGMNRAAVAKAWREFFCAIGVNSFPTVVTIQQYGTDHQPGPELNALLTSADPSVRKRVLEEIDREWQYYGKFLLAQIPGRRGQMSSVRSQFSHFLREAPAPTKSGSSARLCETFIDQQHVRAVFGNSVPYLDANVSSVDFLNSAGVTHCVDTSACFRRLDALRESGRFRIRDVKLIYRELERLWSTDRSNVTSGLQVVPRIYVSGLRKWLCATEVVWESSGTYMDCLYPPLAPVYSEHRDFFCKQLGIAIQPTPSALIDALASIGEYDATPEERQVEAIKIYRRLDRLLETERDRDPDAKPQWLHSLKTRRVFLDHVGRLVEATNDLYVADDEMLAKALRQHESVSLLAVSPSQIPPLDALLRACGVPRLTQVARSGLKSANGDTLDKDATARIRKRRLSLMRLAYSRAHGIFGAAKRTGMWKDLDLIEVRSATALELSVDVGEYAVSVPAETCHTTVAIYMLEGIKGKMDRLARELCHFIGADPRHLAEGVYRILTASSEHDLEEYFDVNSLPEIPQDEIDDVEPSNPSPETIRGKTADGTMEDHMPPGQEATIRGPTDQVSIDEQPGHSPASVGPGGRQRQRNEGKEQQPSGPRMGPEELSEQSTAPIEREEQRDRKPSGRLISYAEAQENTVRDENDSAGTGERLRIANAAIAFVLESERKDGQDVVEMPFSNEGFDIRRQGSAGEEYIEVKGLSGAWDASGVVVTPAELRMAERQRGRYWLYVVEYATDPAQSRISRIRDPFGKTNQFRFDAGWKGAREGASVRLEPAAGLRLTIEGVGAGEITAVMQAGPLRRVTIRLDSGDEITRTFDPKQMIVSGGS